MGNKGHNAKTRLQGVVCRLADLGACEDALDWLSEQSSWEQAWKDCAEPRWLLWLAARLAKTKAARTRVLKCFKAVATMIEPHGINANVVNGLNFYDALGGDMVFAKFKPNAANVVRRRFKMPRVKKITALAKKEARRRKNAF